VTVCCCGSRGHHTKRKKLYAKPKVLRPLVTSYCLRCCESLAQRLWNADAQRQLQDSSRDINLSGFDPRDRITREQRDAFDYLKGRRFRSASIRDLTYAFALNSDEGLRSKFKLSLQSFPQDLPYNYEEEKVNEAYSADRVFPNDRSTCSVFCKIGNTKPVMGRRHLPSCTKSSSHG
jgi:hypothetical protein